MDYKFVETLHEAIDSCVVYGSGHAEINEFDIYANWVEISDDASEIVVYVLQDGVIKIEIPIAETMRKT